MKAIPVKSEDKTLISSATGCRQTFNMRCSIPVSGKMTDTDKKAEKYECHSDGCNNNTAISSQMSTRKMNVNIEVFKCVYCNRDFKSKSDVVSHLKVYHLILRSFENYYNRYMNRNVTSFVQTPEMNILPISLKLEPAEPAVNLGTVKLENKVNRRNSENIKFKYKNRLGHFIYLQRFQQNDRDLKQNICNAAKISRNDFKCDYACNICGRKFNEHQLLRDHVKSLHKLKMDNKMSPIYRYDRYGRMFNKQFGTLEHANTKTGSDVRSNGEQNQHYSLEVGNNEFNVLTCAHCGKIYHNKFELECHMKTIHVRDCLSAMDITVRKTHADVLSREYGNQQFRKAGDIASDIENDSQTDCHVTNTTMTNIITEYQSILNRFETDLTSTECLYCKRRFRSKRNLISHMKEVHNVDTTSPFGCKICNKQYKMRYTLLNHNRVYHPQDEDEQERNKILEAAAEIVNGETVYVCRVCKRYILSSREYLAHDRNHKRLRQFTCEYCGRQKTTKARLQTHIRAVHLNIRKYSCDLCEKTFFFKKGRDDHRRLHTGERPFACETCGHTFSSSNSLICHRRVHNNYYPHCCTFCPKKYKYSNLLVNHIRTHTGERPYKCELCPKAFTDSSKYSTHVKVTHSNNRPFCCSLCGNTFKSNKFLKRHMKLHAIKKHIQARRRNTIPNGCQSSVEETYIHQLPEEVIPANNVYVMENQPEHVTEDFDMSTFMAKQFPLLQ